MTRETKLFLGIMVVTAAVVLGGVALFSRPAPTISNEVLAPATAWATGSATPKATLIEFSDFQCPACKSVEPTVEAVISKYSGSLRFVYRHFPLSQHPFAGKAAAVAEAAGMQGKFWEMNRLLFVNQEQLSDELFPKLAGQLGLDLAKFNKDRESESVKKRVNDDVAVGNLVGINATPTFFLNGKKLELKSFADLETAVVGVLK